MNSKLDTLIEESTKVPRYKNDFKNKTRRSLLVSKNPELKDKK